MGGGEGSHISLALSLVHIVFLVVLNFILPFFFILEVKKLDDRYKKLCKKKKFEAKPCVLSSVSNLPVVICPITERRQQQQALLQQ